MPFGDRQSWTLVDRDAAVVEPVEGFLAHLHAVERSPNTVKAYAHDLRDWFEFLDQRGLVWSRVRLEDVGRFVAWLRLPVMARAGNVAALPTAEAVCSEATVNRKLSAISAFYEFHQRHGVDLGDLLTTWQPARDTVGRGGRCWRTWDLGRNAAGGSGCGRSGGSRIRWTASRSRRSWRHVIGCGIGSCFSCWPSPGCGSVRRWGCGTATSIAAARLVSVVPRVNANRARAKGAGDRQVPVSARVIRLYADYLHGEYGDLDSDYVFVNLWSGPIGYPLTYASVYDLVCRIRERTGISVRAAYLSAYVRDRVVAARGGGRGGGQHYLGHASIATTSDAYAHLKVEDARRALVAAGWLADQDEPR